MPAKGEKKENHVVKRQDQEPDMKTMELLTLIEKYPAVILILLVSTRHPKIRFKKLPILK